MNKGTLSVIPVAEIDEGERFRKDYQDTEALADSIRKQGLICPIAVMDRREFGEPYLLLAGGRRLFAVKEHLNWDSIQAKVYPKLTDLETREVELYENLQRAELTYAEEVHLKRRIHELQIEKHGAGYAGPGNEEGATIEKTAGILNVSGRNLARDLELSEAILETPELGAMKNKSAAYNELKKQKVDLLHKALAERTKKRMESLDVEKQRLINSYIIGDAFEKIAEIPDNQMHCVELDPPYAVALAEISKAQAGESIHKDYNEIPAEEYPEFIAKILSEAYRVLRPGGWLLMWHANRWQGLVSKGLSGVGFKYHDVPALWVKPEPGNSRAPAVNLGIQYEPFFYARKGEAQIMKQGRGDVFTYARPKQRFHPAERPVQLLQDILSTFLMPGSRILVPFLGSGNTLLAASNLGMRAHGYELSDSYKDHYIVRVSEGQLGSYRSETGDAAHGEG
jgi:site-specific DNA-methyltransferase (adenine-specific)